MAIPQGDISHASNFRSACAACSRVKCTPRRREWRSESCLMQALGQTRRSRRSRTPDFRRRRLPRLARRPARATLSLAVPPYSATTSMVLSAKSASAGLGSWPSYRTTIRCGKLTVVHVSNADTRPAEVSHLLYGLESSDALSNSATRLSISSVSMLFRV